jgi:hypothetical protein
MFEAMLSLSSSARQGAELSTTPNSTLPNTSEKTDVDQGDSGQKPTSSISNDGHLAQMHRKAFGRRTSSKEITLEDWRLWNDNTKIYFRDCIKLIRESGPTDGVSTTR